MDLPKLAETFLGQLAERERERDRQGRSLMPCKQRSNSRQEQRRNVSWPNRQNHGIFQLFLHNPGRSLTCQSPGQFL